MKSKIIKLIKVFILSIFLWGCSNENLNEEIPSSFINETLKFDLTVDVPTPTAGSGSLRGSKIEKLVPVYATSYDDDEYLEKEVRYFRQWQWFELYTSLADKALEEPGHLNTYRLQAEVYLTNSKYVPALSALDKVLAKNHDDIYALGLSAYVKHFLGDRTQSKARLAALRNVSPECADTLESLIKDVDVMLRESHGNGLENPKFEYDSIAILGVSPSADGKITASAVLRIKEAVKAAYYYPNAKIIISGGPVDTDYAEAQVMADYLIKYSNDLAQALELTTDSTWTIPKERVLLDLKARDTVGNAIGVFEHLKANDLHNTLIVASTSQIMRANIIFNCYAKANNYLLNVDTTGSGEVEATNNEYYYSYVGAAKAFGLFTFDDYSKYSK